jgi:hypothetical protein
MGSEERDEWKWWTTNHGFNICSDGKIVCLYVCLGSDRDITSSQLQSCLNYNIQALVGGNEEEEVEEQPLHNLFSHGTQFEYHEEIYEVHAVSPERITAVPVDTNDGELDAVYFITAAQKLQLLDLIDHYN